MFGDKQSIGFLFYGVSELWMEASNLVKSESDLVVKIARNHSRLDKYSHGRQVPRNIRAGKATVDDISNLFECLPFKKPLPPYSSTEDEANYLKGEWYLVQSLISGVQQAADDKFADVKEILLFIEAHCKIERDFLLQFQKQPKEENVAKYLSEWLRLDEKLLLEKGLKSDIAILVRSSLYWCSMLEKIAATWIYESESNLLSSIVPSFDPHKELFYPSSEKLLERFKSMYEQEYHNGKRKPWTYFYRHIAVRKQQDKQLGEQYYTDDVDPDIESIKKQFLRWKKGDLFSFSAFRKNVLISHYSFKGSDKELEAFLIYFISNYLTLVQKKLFTRIDKRTDTFALIELMINEYGKVEEVKALVERRFQHFLKVGSIEP